MKFLQYILTAGMIGIFFFQSGCNKKNKWKAVPLQVNKQESFNYSEMISGDLDSSAKSDLEAVKKNTTEKKASTNIIDNVGEKIIYASPSVRKLARELDCDLNMIKEAVKMAEF